MCGPGEGNLPTYAIPQPANWPNIKTTYDNSIYQKLMTTASTNAATDRQWKIDAISYWIARLARDLTLINNGGQPDSS